MKILIIDDHPVIHIGLTKLLAQEFHDAFFANAYHPQDGLDLSSREDCSLVILDIEIPGRGGLEVLRQIKSRRNRLPVIIYTLHSEEQFAIRSLKAGAYAFVNKAAPIEQLIQAVRQAATGRRFVSPQLGEMLAAHYSQDLSGEPVEELSDREFQVLRMIASGMTMTSIADALSLSVKTVSTYKARIQTKLGLRSTPELIRFAIDYGLDG